MGLLSVAGKGESRVKTLKFNYKQDFNEKIILENPNFKIPNLYKRLEFASPSVTTLQVDHFSVSIFFKIF